MPPVPPRRGGSGGPPRFRAAPRALDYTGGPRWISSTGNTTSGLVRIDPATVTGANGYFAAPDAVNGDLVVAQLFMRTLNSVWNVGVTGGQNWIKCATHQGASGSFATFFCQFNGTWSAAPRFDNVATESVVGYIHVFRPTDPNNRWALEQSPLLNSAAGTAFTIAGTTPRANNTVALACVASQDDNEYTLTTPGRWAWAGVKQQRTTGGTDAAMACVYLTQIEPSATGAVTLTQATLGADAGITAVLVFKEGADFEVGAVSGRVRAPFTASPNRRRASARPTEPGEWQGGRADDAGPFTRLGLMGTAMGPYGDFTRSTGALSAAVGMATETDTAYALARVKTKSAAQANETDTASALARRKAKGAAQANETDTASSLARQKAKAVGSAIETDTASALTRRKAKSVGQAIETDTASALARRKIRACGTAIETDTASGLGRRKAKAVGQANETDTAYALGKARARTTGQANETDTAYSLARRKAKPVGRADETDTAYALAAATGLEAPVGMAIETDTAYALGKVKIRVCGRSPSDTFTPSGTSRRQWRGFMEASFQ